jgi:hypothetical protein
MPGPVPVRPVRGAATPAVPPAVARRRWRASRALPARRRIPVKVVVVTMFEIGQDTGDAPGEFQFWRERRKLDVRIPFRSRTTTSITTPRARSWAW